MQRYYRQEDHDCQGNGRSRLHRPRSGADGLRGDGRGQGAGELRDHLAEYWRVVAEE